MLNLTKRGRRAAIGGVLSGAVLTAMTFAGTAGAQQGTAQNNTIVGSGSSSDYYMMENMDLLFNEQLGCYMTQSANITTPQPLNFECASTIPGNVDAGQQDGYLYTENPINDVATDEPALGSSAGIDQLEYQGPGSDGTNGTPTAPINYARSSRAFKTSDYPGLNFVGYATDAISWFTFTTTNVGGTQTHTPSYYFPTTDMTLTDLKDIWNGTYTNWDQIPNPNPKLKHPDPVNAPICVYIANPSSGTVATWANALAGGNVTTLDAYVNTNPTYLTNNCSVPSGTTYAESHTLPENYSQQIVQNGDAADAIFFMSYGKYQLNCVKKLAFCTNKSGDTPRLGEINAIPANTNTIYCGDDNIANNSECGATGTGSFQAFPVTRYLYNVYSNGTFTPSDNAEYGFPVATPATLNYVSEAGYICKPQVIDTASSESTPTIKDPTTGLYERTNGTSVGEIDQVITENGFLTIPFQSDEYSIAGQTPSLETPAVTILADEGDTTYLQNDPIVNSGDLTASQSVAANETQTTPGGYCVVWSTNGNTPPKSS